MKKKENTLHNVNEITETSKRFLHVLKTKDYSGYKLEKENSGITSSQISHIKSGRNQPSTDLIDKLLLFFPDINRVWLLTGEGSMLNNNDEYVEIEVDNIENLPIKKIPFYDVDFYSGFTKIFNDQTVAPSYYFYLPEFHNAQFAIKNSGKSMSKELGNDDILGLREVPEWQTYFPQGEIYAVVTTNDLRTIKKVRRDKDNKNLVLIPKPLDVDKFDYPEYEEVPISMVTALFQVVASTHSKKLAL